MKNKNNNHLMFVVLLVVSVISSFLLGQFFGSKSMFDYSLAKEIVINKIYDNKEIVYCKEIYIIDKLTEDLNSEKVKSELPIINLNYQSVKNINNEIEKSYKDLIDENIITKDMININSLNYKYYINNNILSLIIEFKLYNYTASFLTYEYKTYNINIDTGEIIDNNKLISYKNITIIEGNVKFLRVGKTTFFNSNTLSQIALQSKENVCLCFG